MFLQCFCCFLSKSCHQKLAATSITSTLIKLIITQELKATLHSICSVFLMHVCVLFFNLYRLSIFILPELILFLFW